MISSIARRRRGPTRSRLIDPPDRPSFTDGPVRRLTYADADRAISALAARLRGFGLPTDSVVAIQLPNTVESVIALLAVMRAGLIAAPLPLLVAPRGCGGGAQPRRGARADRLPAHRRYRAWRSCDAHRDGDLHHPLRMRVWREHARRRGADRRYLRPRKFPAGDRALRGRGGSCRAGDFRHHARRHCAGCAQSRGADRRRACGASRSAHRAGSHHARRARARVIRRARRDRRAVAPHRRHARAASSRSRRPCSQRNARTSAARLRSCPARWRCGSRMRG